MKAVEAQDMLTDELMAQVEKVLEGEKLSTW